jgi:hypothetical protein
MEKENNLIKEIIFLTLRDWYLFVISFLIGLLILFLINRYTLNIYSATCSIAIKDEKSKFANNELLLSDQIRTAKLYTSINNEIYLLKTRDFMSDCLEKCDFHVSYISVGNVIESEVYGSELNSQIYY